MELTLIRGGSGGRYVDLHAREEVLERLTNAWSVQKVPISIESITEVYWCRFSGNSGH